MVPSEAAGHHVLQPRVAVRHVAAPAAMPLHLAASVPHAAVVQVLLVAVLPHPVVAVEHLAVAVAVPLAAVADTSEEAADK